MKHRTNSKVRSVKVNHTWKSGIIRLEDRRSSKSLLKGREGLLLRGAPMKWDILPKTVSEGSGQVRKAWHKLPIKIGKTKKGMKRRDVSRLGPVTDCLDLSLLHLDA